MIGGLLRPEWALPRSLAVFELAQSNVTVPYVKLRPFRPAGGGFRSPVAKNPSPGLLVFTGWDLATAVLKGDHLRRFSLPGSSALGFLLEHHGLLDWGQPELRLLPRTVSAMGDSWRASVASRVGQGVAILAMQGRGYTFVDLIRPRNGQKRPDFMFVSSTSPRSRALVEAKGSLVAPGNEPAIKEELAGALVQLATRSVARRKTFGIATYVREAGDGHDEPSLVALVDPENEGEDHDQPDDQFIVRGNYAAWLDLMGLHGMADSLWRDQRPRETVATVLNAEIGGLKWGVTVAGLVSTAQIEGKPEAIAVKVVVTGLPLEVITAAWRSTRRPGTRFDLPTQLPPWRDLVSADADFVGGCLTDGCLLGAIEPQRLNGAIALEDIL